MGTSKKTKALLLAFLLLFAVSVCSTGIAAKGYSGADFTSDASLAEKLDNVFQGKIALFSNTDKTYPVGSRLDNKFTYYWYNDVTHGQECYAYASAVYCYLFDERPLSQGYYANSVNIDGVQGLGKLSYKTLSEAGIGCGAYVRTTDNADGTYDRMGGHSFILLGYDKKYIIFLAGNADGKGRVAITKNTWSAFNKSILKTRKISFIIQPKATMTASP